MLLRLVGIAAIVSATATIVGALTGQGWPLDILAAGLPTMAAASLGSGLVLLITGRWIVGVIAVASAGLASLSLFTVDHVSPPKTAAWTGDINRPGMDTRRSDPGVVLLWCNLKGDARALGDLAVLAARINADVVGLSEAPSATPERLQELFPSLPHMVDPGARGASDLISRVVVISRAPLGDMRVREEDPWSGRPYLVAEMDDPGGPITLIVAHPNRPFTPQGMAARDALIDAVAADTPDHGRFVVMGDFNVAPWAPAYKALPGVRAGNPALEATWVSRWPGLGLTIDHVLIGDQVELLSYWIGPSIGSDHLPLITRVQAKGG